MSKGGGSGGPSSEFYDKMLELSQQSQQLGDLYSAIDLKGYRPGGTADKLSDKYYKMGDYAPDENAKTPEETASFQKYQYQGQTYSYDPATRKMYDGSGNEVSSNVATHVTTLGQAGDGSYQPHDGRSVGNKSGYGASGLLTGNSGTAVNSSSGYGAAGLSRGYNPSDNMANQINKGPLSDPNVQQQINAMPEKYGFTNPVKYGSVNLDSNGDPIYRSQSGQTFNASTQGAQQMGTEMIMSVMEPARDLEYDTIKSQQQIIPSSTEATISGNELTAATNRGALSLIPKKTEVSNKYLDETLKGMNVNQKMNEASTDVATAFRKSDQATVRSMARMGVSPSSGSFQSSTIDRARADIAARGNARRTTEDENYRRLGAAGLF